MSHMIFRIKFARNVYTRRLLKRSDFCANNEMKSNERAWEERRYENSIEMQIQSGDYSPDFLNLYKSVYHKT